MYLWRSRSGWGWGVWYQRTKIWEQTNNSIIKKNANILLKLVILWQLIPVAHVTCQKMPIQSCQRLGHKLDKYQDFIGITWLCYLGISLIIFLSSCSYQSGKMFSIIILTVAGSVQSQALPSKEMINLLLIAWGSPTEKCRWGCSDIFLGQSVLILVYWLHITIFDLVSNLLART